MIACCCPVRPLLYVLATLGILRSGVQIYWTHNDCRIVIASVYLLINVFLIFAVKRKEIKMLKWGQRLALLCLCGSLIPFLLFPVLSASAIASGKLDNLTDLAFADDVIGNWSLPDQHFYMAAFVGFAIELGAGIMIGVELLKYLLMSRIWRAAADGDLFDEDNFRTP